ncbi:hypothetical protein LSTR_LSTR005460 [Laodelphax striatellus]|uniref:Uncharacterized protein n=1 Tax=Laodelphax striatellus TaxID=195883 RepID=A0A482WY37_LAOST|nr:hypothetical protein LSTR_LSTR005460 [Laodelphax striatellus]
MAKPMMDINKQLDLHIYSMETCHNCGRYRARRGGNDFTSNKINTSNIKASDTHRRKTSKPISFAHCCVGTSHVFVWIRSITAFPSEQRLQFELNQVLRKDCGIRTGSSNYKTPFAAEQRAVSDVSSSPARITSGTSPRRELTSINQLLLMRLLLLPRWLAARCWLHNEFHLLSRLFDLERAIFIPALPLLSDRGVAALAVEWLAVLGGMFRMSCE